MNRSNAMKSPSRRAMGNWKQWVMCLALVACGVMAISCDRKTQPPKTRANGPKAKIVMGFAQVGSESDWRAANTVSIKTSSGPASPLS